MSTRTPAGPATGALAGLYPDPALGLVPSAGVSFHDDFLLPVASGVAARLGDRLWQNSTIGGTAATPSTGVPLSWTEAGVVQLTTGAVANTGSVYHHGASMFYRHPGPGSIFATKLRITTGTANYECWAGFSETATRITGATACDFLGVRAVGGNVFGVARNGTTETTVDLGLDIEGTTWRTVGFEVTGTTAAPIVQFFQLENTGANWVRTNIGTSITTNMPDVGTRPVIGLVTTAAASVTMQMDWWALGGRCPR